MTKTTLVLIGISLLGSDLARADQGGPCLAQPEGSFTETFSDGSNEGAWSVSGGGVIESHGGHPGAYLRGDLDTFAPLAQTAWSGRSLFTGDYRASGVMGLAADFEIFSASLTTEERLMSLMFISDAGTPDDRSDDLFVFYVGPDNIPAPGKGWGSYQFEVPSHSSTLPFPRSQVDGEPGWVASRGDVFTPAPDPDAAWNMVMADVDQVIFWFHDPRQFALIQSWNVGMDNPTIFSCADASRAE